MSRPTSALLPSAAETRKGQRHQTRVVCSGLNLNTPLGVHTTQYRPPPEEEISGRSHVTVQEVQGMPGKLPVFGPSGTFSAEADGLADSTDHLGMICFIVPRGRLVAHTVLPWSQPGFWSH